MSALNGNHYKVLWIFGSLEALCALGAVGGVKYHIKDYDVYNQVDENRDLISIDDIIGIIRGMVKAGDIEPEHEEGIITLLIDYKDDRQKITRYFLEKMVAA